MLQHPIAWRRRLRGATAALLAACVVRAGGALPGALSLTGAQNLALQRNADLRVAEAAVQVAAAQLRIARQWPNPTLGLNVARIRTDAGGNRTTAGNSLLDRSYDSLLSLSQLIELGKRGPRRESAVAGHRAAEALRDDARRLLLLTVTQAYVAALQAGENARVLEASAASLRREAGVAARRLEAGDISRTDQAQIEIAAGRFALDAEDARQAATTAVVLLESLLGDPAPAGRTTLTDSLAGLGAPEPADAAHAAAGLRPDLAAAEAALAKADADLTLQRRARVPDLTLSVQYERNPPDSPNSAGLGVSLPLPLWHRSAGEVQAALAARHAAEAQLEKVRLQAAAEIATARSALAAADTRRRTFVEELEPRSADVVRAVTFAYENGGASLLDLLSAQRNDNDVRLAAVRARADFASAGAGLAAALNRLQPAATP